ncbi:MAG TPA: hypothetical protein VFO40_05130 [Chthoniobacterales bacterium]|nr:hypothetical protein [Chthoniobacterales bacterium]
MYFRPYENLPKSEAERKWLERIMALGCPVEKIRKPFWYKHVKVYIFPNRCPEAEFEPNQWHAQFWASSTVTITPCCKSYREVKKLAKRMIKKEKTREWL